MGDKNKNAICKRKIVEIETEFNGKLNVDK